jgi:hypothetical protein
VRRLALALLILAATALGRPAAAHEVRPAYLEIEQTGPATYQVSWKQPTLGDVAVHLAPHLSNGWLEQPPSGQFAAEGYLIKTWRVRAATAAPLAAQTVTIEGLEQTITDVFVRVRLSHGQGFEAVLRPEAPSLKLGLVNGSALSNLDFLGLGLRHILSGPDHLLFVLGLLLLVRDRGTLLKTVSAFTAAHSLTLAAASFGLIAVPLHLLDALIALSILFLAPEIVRAQRGGTSLTIRHPWMVAFAFGLLHGLGFAGGLTGLGLERGVLVRALVLFNLGVEAGQLAFIALVLTLRRASRLMQIDWPRPVAAAPTYAVGVLGAVWTLQLAALALGAAP